MSKKVCRGESRRRMRVGGRGTGVECSSTVERSIWMERLEGDGVEDVTREEEMYSEG